MTQSYPPPPIQPLERLQPTDGLVMNAERWRQAHDYHRHRQNIHYQSLNQPGIVCGLGVNLVAAPNNLPAQYRDNRWVQIQPGIAIDAAGNPIVIPQAESYRLSAEPFTTEPLMVYLVVSYVDPDKLQRREVQTLVRETFRIDEKTNPPTEMEVEICRILLQPGFTELVQPADPLFPQYNALDLRHRTQVQVKPQAVVQMAQVTHADPTYSRNLENLTFLMESVPALYPSLQGAKTIGQVALQPQSSQPPYLQDGLGDTAAYDLLYLTGREALVLSETEFTVLQQYVAMGGVLLVDAPADATNLIESVQILAQNFNTPLAPLESLSRRHPLRTQPFLFAGLPMFTQNPIQLLVGGGILLVIGELAAAWGLDDALTLSRTSIRTAQELGINLLHYAWQRRRLTGLLRPPGVATASKSKPTTSKDILDQLMF